MNNSIGRIVGGALLVVGTAAVWMWPRARVPEAAPEPIRPVRSAVVRDATTMPELKFSGTVKAGADRTLSFKQSGRIARIPVAKGQMVRKGDRLAWLLQDDFRNALAQDEAAVSRDKLTCERVTRAAAKNAVSREDVSRAEANLKQSEAKYALAKRALDETVLYAPFDCVVADIPATELNMTGPSDPIVVLLDLSTIRIDAAVPESVVIRQHQLKCRDCGVRISATFDSIKSQSYPVTFVEYKATADVRNQTFTATYQLPAPEGLVLLPGMSATITVPGDAYERVGVTTGRVEIPGAAVGVAGDGGYYAWRLDEVSGEQGICVAHRCGLGACVRIGDVVRVSSGLKAGERIATAGVTMLTEGRRVRLLEDTAK